MTDTDITDAEEAEEYARSFVGTLAGRYDWGREALDLALGDIDEAAEEADEADWWGSDAEVFWDVLFDRSLAWDLEGADDAREVFAAAAHRAWEAEERAEDYGVDDYAGAVAEGAVETVNDALEELPDAAPKLLDWKLWAGVAAAALGLAWLL